MARVKWTPRRWTMLRRLVQYAALLAFVALFVWSRRGGWPASVVNFPLRLDPLAMLSPPGVLRSVSSRLSGDWLQHGLG